MRHTSEDAFADHELVHRFLATRSEGAFRALYRRHTAAMHAVAKRLLGGNEADAEDVIQEAWVRAARSLPGFRWRSTLRVWLTGIAVNCARNRYRRRSAEAVSSSRVTELPAPAHLEGAIDRVALERAVERLPDGYREVLVLHDVYGYTHDEIGEMLGIESGTSKSQLSRARNALRRWLTDTGEEGHERRSS
jgi:RNA polymerase sigma-70 factor (ECF subfamily)